MRKLFIIIIIFSLTNCRAKQGKLVRETFDNSKKITLNLVDSLGDITLWIPIRYDTSFNWINYSDCGIQCNRQEYRLQPKFLPVLEESGWIPPLPEDSIDQITISHSMYMPKRNTNLIDSAAHDLFKTQLKSIPREPQIIFDTLQKINDRSFSIFTMSGIDSISGSNHLKVIAFTTILGNDIRFEYMFTGKKTNSLSKDFIDNSMKSIHSIVFSKQ